MCDHSKKIIYTLLSILIFPIGILLYYDYRKHDESDAALFLVNGLLGAVLVMALLFRFYLS